MQAVCCSEGRCIVTRRCRRGSGRLYEQARPLSLLLAACVFVACAHRSDPRYLDAGEIQEFVIGNSLKDAKSGDWREDFLPVDSERREGVIHGHSGPPEGLYGGAWELRGNSVCMRYWGESSRTTCYRFAWAGDNKFFWIDEAGRRAFETELIERGGADDVAVEAASTAFRSETVTFRHGVNLLVGDLRFPDGPAPYPAILYVDGSGGFSRHRFDDWPGNAVLQEALSRGFATFVWSKPGVDDSTGDWREQSMALRAEEVVAAIEHLEERADIDGDRIGLLGVSQAGWVMPLVPTQRDVAFVVAISCPGQSPFEHERYPTDKELASTGISEAERKDAGEHLRTLFEILRSSVTYEEYLRRHQEWLAEAKLRTWYPAVSSKQTELPSVGWYLSEPERESFGFVSTALANDTPPPLKNLRMPVLAIFGAEDSRVDPVIGAKMYEEIPLANGNRDVTVQVYHGANHSLLVPDSEGYLEFAPGYVTTIGEWLAAHR